MKHSTTSLETLKSSWQTLLQSFSVEYELRNNVFIDLLTIYSSANRFYHTLDHVYQVLKIINSLQDLSLNFSALQFAAWFHDAIYDTHYKDNEEKSAEYAEVALNFLEIPKATVNKVKFLILATKNHQALPTDVDSQILLDADLAILGSSELEYREYAQAIRKEYYWVSETDYCIGRRRVLQNFLQRDKIYSTHQLFTLLEERAKQNLLAEVAALSSV